MRDSAERLPHLEARLKEVMREGLGFRAGHGFVQRGVPHFIDYLDGTKEEAYWIHYLSDTKKILAAFCDPLLTVRLERELRDLTVKPHQILRAPPLW